MERRSRRGGSEKEGVGERGGREERGGKGRGKE